MNSLIPTLAKNVVHEIICNVAYVSILVIMREIHIYAQPELNTN